MPVTSDLDLARERIDAALREYNLCQACGAPMVVSAHADGLWIECGSLGGRRGIQRLIASGLHDRHPIDLPDRLLVAA